jgi:hypothetical protein
MKASIAGGLEDDVEILLKYQRGPFTLSTIEVVLGDHAVHVVHADDHLFILVVGGAQDAVQGFKLEFLSLGGHSNLVSSP